MKNIWKRSLSMLLALVMIVGMLPVGVLAEEQETSVECAHNYVPGETVAPTCTEAGYTLYTCDTCGDSYEADVVEALDHDWEVDDTQKVCIACGATETISVTGEDEESEEQPEEDLENQIMLLDEGQDVSQNDPLSTANGILWIDKNKATAANEAYQEDALDLRYIFDTLAGGRMPELVNRSLGLSGASVLFDGVDLGDRLQVAFNTSKLAAIGESMQGDVRKHAEFQVNDANKKIAFVNILSASPVSANGKYEVHKLDDNNYALVIANAGEPVDLAAQLDGIVDNIRVLTYDPNYPLTLEQARAVNVSWVEFENVKWPELGGENVPAGVCTFTLVDDVDGTTRTLNVQVLLDDTREAFTVQYLDDAGFVLKSEVVEKDADVPVPPTEVNHSTYPNEYFNSMTWSPDPSKIESVQRDLEFTAHWELLYDINENWIPDQVETFNVTFMDRGSQYENVPTKWGTTAVKPADPTRQYYTFGGWFSNLEDETTKFDPDAQVREDATYYAKWTPVKPSKDDPALAWEEDSYTISFYVQQADGTIVPYGNPETVLWGSDTPAPEENPVPANFGYQNTETDTYQFAGWFVKGDNDEVTDTPIAAKVTDDAAYIAKISKDPIVSYVASDGSKGNLSLIEEENGFKVVFPAKEIMLPNASYHWVGWFTDAAHTTPFVETTLITSDITLYAYYYSDMNGNEIEDGSEDDPYIYIAEKVGENLDVFQTLKKTDGTYIDVDNGLAIEWLVTDAEGNLTIDEEIESVIDTNADNVVFLGWTGPVEEVVAYEGATGTVQVTAQVFTADIQPDRNNNGYADGDPVNDPFTYFSFLMPDGTSLHDVEVDTCDPDDETKIGVLAGEKISTDDFIARVRLSAGQSFEGWVETEGTYKNSKLLTYTADIFTDKNGNDIPDEEEEDVLTLSGVEGEWNFNNGVLSSQLGTIKVYYSDDPNHSILLDEGNGKYTFAMTNKTVIEVIPNTAYGYYVDAIELSGKFDNSWEVI